MYRALVVSSPNADRIIAAHERVQARVLEKNSLAWVSPISPSLAGSYSFFVAMGTADKKEGSWSAVVPLVPLHDDCHFVVVEYGDMETFDTRIACASDFARKSKLLGDVRDKRLEETQSRSSKPLSKRRRRV